MRIIVLVVGELQTNTYLVGCPSTGEALIIDPGAEGGRILAAASRAGLRPTLICLTHGHADHIGAVAEIRRALNLPVLIHAEDAHMLTDPQANLSVWLGRGFAVGEPDRCLHDGEEITCGKLQFQVLHTPGHTPGSICLYAPGVLFSGDTLFAGSVGRTDFPGGDWKKLLHSVRTKLLVLPDETVVYPGHGASTTIGEEREQNPFLTGEEMG
ncbi:MBL fold metallo-hydrolase [Ammonifex thiophilus]|uniref:MBL fold metallo-hydrolase n=1 Tax=Ammonifex thiophilus TaxID=444093 RepID=A0A3D8P473_9THEO|nr:MBL fold metallo-hydrolase [Ammonifex thiophilus]RDV82316.1 MBL fold metallo-hydrolase [Ammonifex thiophilus]